MAFEQIIHKHATDIVAGIPSGSTKTKYQTALTQLRLPYWDWAAKLTPIVPTSVSAPTISVTYPNNGTRATISNPLYSYKFHPIDKTQIMGEPFEYWNETKRQPTSSDINAVSQPSLVETALAEDIPSIRNTLYNLLSTYQTYNEFSSYGSGLGFGSIEGIHGSIHVFAGGNYGHMTGVPWSGFDPMFFLHHNNVDRQLALFQYIYPNTYVEAHENGPTFTIESGSIQDANSPLTPFHSNTQGAFFTSNSARNVRNWGYTYPELVGNPSNATLRAKINTLYGSSTTSLKKRAEEDSSSDAPRAYLTEVKIPVNGAQYSVRVSVDGTYVGSHNTVARPNIVDTGMVNTGSIDLTQILKKKFDDGKLKSLDSETVVAFLKDGLTYIVKEAGAEIPAESVKGLDVKVVSTEVVPPKTDSDFPEWVGGFVDHDEVTK